MLQYNPTVSGSLTITGSLTVTNGVIGTVSGVDIQIFSSSINQVISGIQSSTESSDARLSFIETFTSSALTRLTNIESKSASVDISISNINTFTSSNANQSLNSKTGSYATTGSNSFYGTQVFSGSVFIANDLVVQGSSSIQYISASSVSIGTNIVQLNTANPSVRYAGLSIIDSGSVGGSGSFLYDSVQDEFIFVHRGNGTNVTSSHFVLGPETFDNLGNETYLTCNILTKGTGKEHLVDSCIFDNGTTTCIKNNLIGTGTISGTTIYGSTNVCSPVGLFSGCIGIGITNPSVNLDINATGGLGGWTGIRLKTGTSSVQSLSMGQVTAGNGAWIGTAQYNQGGYWQTEGTAAAVLNFESDGTFRISTNSGLTANTNYNITERLRITSAGNVGINTTTPNSVLHIEASNNTTNQFRVNSCDGLNAGVRSYTTCDGPGLLINHYYAVGGSPYLRTSDFVSNQGDGASTQMRFFTKDFNANPALAMIITSGRSIGIGTDAPVTHASAPGLVVKGVGARGIIEVWDGTCGKAVFQQVGGTTYIGNLDKGTSGGSLRLLVNGSGTSATEAMVITCAGRVLINNSAPQNTCADYSRMTISGAYAKTNNCTGFLGSVLHLTSCENDYPFGVKFAIYGDTCSTSRYVGIQTGDHNISNQGNIVFQPSGGRVGIGNSLPSYGLDVCGTVRLTNGSTAQTVIISSTNQTSNATTLQISNSSNSAYNDGIKIIQGGGVLRFHDLNDNALLGFDLSNTRVGVLTTSPGRSLDVNGDSTLRGNNYIASTKMIQWEGGAYWTTRTSNSANQFEIYRGDTGATPFIITAANCIKLNGSFQNFAIVGPDTFTIDTMNAYQSIANGGYVDFAGMSGILFVNNWSNGGVTIWLMGGGNTTSLTSVIATVGSTHHNPAIGGYRWCNNYGSTANFGFQVFRTRNTA